MADNTADELVEGTQKTAYAAKKAIQAGKNTVKAGKTIAKAGAKAAIGNLAGAAIDIVKDPTARRAAIALILCILFFVSFLLITALYILPMMIYETVQHAANDANESFAQSYYSTNESGIIGNLIGITKGTGRWILTWANTLKNIFTGNLSAVEQASDVFDYDTMVSNDSEIVSGEGTHVISLWNKMDQIKAKYEVRVNAIEKAITEKEADKKEEVESEGYTGKTKDFILLQAYREFCETYDPDWDSLVSASWIPAYVEKELTSNQALEIAALYNVINDNDFDATQLSDFLKWLGYNAPQKGDTLHLKVMDDDTELTGWTGTFMPQYLVDEAKAKAKEAAEIAREKKVKELDKLFFRIIEFATTEERQTNAIQKAYDKAYQKVIAKYEKEYGVSLTDLMIYCYTGKLTQTEELGADDTDKNLLVQDGDSILSAKKYSKKHPLKEHPQYTFQGWRYSNYGSSGQVDLLQQFINKNGLTNYEFTDSADNTDGTHEGHIKLKTESRPKVYTRNVSFSMWYDDYDDTWYYRYNGTLYTSNPLANNADAKEKYLDAVNKLSPAYAYGYGNKIYASGWGSYPTVYEKIGNNYYPVPISFNFTDSYTVMEPYVSAQFFKYYYRVTYFCPYYIACRDKSEMLSIPGLLDGDYTLEKMAYSALTEELVLDDDENPDLEESHEEAA